MDRSVAFYREILNAEIHYQSEHWTAITLGGVKMGLHGGGGRTGEFGWVIGLLVDDARSVQAKLKANGVDVDEELHEIPNGLVLAFRDPDGNTFQATQRA